MHDSVNVMHESSLLFRIHHVFWRIRAKTGADWHVILIVHYNKFDNLIEMTSRLDRKFFFSFLNPFIVNIEKQEDMILIFFFVYVFWVLLCIKTKRIYRNPVW